MTRRPGAVRFRSMARIAFVAALLVVAVLLLAPGESLPESGVSDKLEHAGVFAFLGLLGAWAFPDRGRWWVIPLALIAFGGMCEILQAWVPGRSASLEDAFADALGVLAGTGGAAALRRLAS